MDFTFFNALLTNTYESYLHGYYLMGYFDSFINNLPVKYRNVLRSNRVVIYDSNHWDANGVVIAPSKYWNDLEDVSEDNVTVADFMELLSIELIRIEASVLKKGVLAWRLRLIGSSKKEIIKAEYERLMLQLPLYEAEIQNAVHLQPYCNILLALIDDIRKDVSILKVYCDDAKLIADANSPSIDDSNPKDRENKFNQVPLKQVKAHFEILTTRRSKKNNKPHLTQEQLDRFIEVAFLKQSEVGEVEKKLLMNLDRGELQSIRKVFYDFYKAYRYEYESTSNSKDKYVRLLTNYFEGFDYKKIADNFDK